MPLLFGLVNPKLDSDATLLLLVTLASAVGSFVHIGTSFANYAGRNRFETSWVTWYALRCPIGAALATVFYFVVRAGFFSGDAPNSAVNAYGIAAVAGFVGLFSRQATDKLRELFDTLFKTDSTEEEVDPVLGSVTPNPVIVDGDPVRLTLSGSGFVRLSEVRVDGRALPPASVGPTQIAVEVPAADLRGKAVRRGQRAQSGPVRGLRSRRRERAGGGLRWTITTGWSPPGCSRVASSRSWARARTCAAGPSRASGRSGSSCRAVRSWPPILAEKSRYPEDAEADLLRVSQYVDAVLGEQALYEYLRSAFDADYPPNALHRLLVDVAVRLRERGRPGLLILTTNYDDALERAFEEAGESYQVLWYDAKRGSGHFMHRANGKVAPIRKPNETLTGDRALILKLHGAVDRTDPKVDSYVITEDDYIDYEERIPVNVRARMADSHFLFLGYSLRDWNLRVILSRIWEGRRLASQSWAVQRENGRISEIEQKLWRSRGDVDLLYVGLDEYVAKLRAEMPDATQAAA